MKTLLLAVAVLGTGCQTGPVPDLVSEHGVSFFWRGAQWTPEDIAEQENWFLENVPGDRYPQNKVLEAMSWAEVYLTPDPIPCQGSRTGFCNGLQDYERLHVRDLGCPFNSAYTHELGHWLQQILNRDDYQHLEKDFWEVADGRPRSCK